MSEKGIFLSARIVAILDVFSALCSERPHREAYSNTKIKEIMSSWK
jgi:HD-GYP domain-containing protein (c-di-GMP phosphodiesterase class II)